MNLDSNSNQNNTLYLKKKSVSELIKMLNNQMNDIKESLTSSKTIDCTKEIINAYEILKIAKKRRGKEDEKKEIDFNLSTLNLMNCLPEIR